MSLIFTAFVCRNNNDIIGYQVIDTNNYKVSYYDNDKMVKLLKRRKVSGIYVDSNGEVSMAAGYDANRYARIYKDSGVEVPIVLGQNDDMIMIFKPVSYSKNPKTETVAWLKLGDVTKEKYESLKAGGLVRFANGDVIINSNTGVAEFSRNIEHVGKDSATLQKEVDGAKTELAKNSFKMRDLITVPIVTRRKAKDSKLQEMDTKLNMSLDQKVQYVKWMFKNTQPFVYALLCSVKLEEMSDESEQIAGGAAAFATPDGIYVNGKEMLKMPLSEMAFIIKHELYHIAMGHHARGKGKNSIAFNMATDLYINKTICVEHGIKNLNQSVVVPKRTDVLTSDKTYYISMPNVLYNANVDVDKDTPESLYNEIMKNAAERLNERMKNAGIDPNKLKEDLQNGCQGCPNNQSGDGEEGEGQQEGQGTQGGQGRESQSGGQQGGQGSQGGEQSESGGQQGGYSDLIDRVLGEMAEEMMSGGGKFSADLGHTPDTVNKSKEQLKQDNKGILGKAKVIAKKQGYSLKGEGTLERIVEKALAPKINWRSVLRQKLTLVTQKSNSFASPDRRFITRNKIYPGPHRAGEGGLEKVLVAIDTSGSISDKELGIVLAQLDQLFHQYKVEGQLTFWDTKCSEPVPFKKYEDIKSARIEGCGGTDPNCIFEMIEKNRKYRNGMERKPKIILVFTDGFFGNVDRKYAKYADTIWIVFKEYKDSFKAPFGVVAPFKLDD